MAQILVRELEKNVVQRLKKLAKQNGRSLQAEVRIILEDAAQSYTPKLSAREARAEILKLREIFKGRKFPNTIDLIREGRD